jgi:hypothetical protein
MTVATEALSDDLVATVRDVVRERLRPLEPREVRVTLAPDHAGDASIFVDIVYPKTQEPIDLKPVVGLLSKLRDRLWERGEERFSYIFATILPTIRRSKS